MRKKRKKRGESSGRSRRVGRRKMGATGSEVNVKNRLPQMLSLTLSNSDRCLLFLYYNSPLLSLPFTMFHSSAPILSWIYSIYVVASPFHQNVSFEVIDDLHLTKSDGQYLGLILLDFPLIMPACWNFFNFLSATQCFLDFFLPLQELLNSSWWNHFQFWTSKYSVGLGQSSCVFSAKVITSHLKALHTLYKLNFQN